MIPSAFSHTLHNDFILTSKRLHKDKHQKAIES